MIRLALAALLAAAPSLALAQAVTRPTVTASAGYFRAPDVYTEGGQRLSDRVGEDAVSTLTAYSVGLGGEHPVLRRGAVHVSAGARLSAASYGIDVGDGMFGGDLRLQNLALYGRVGTSRASALLGVSLNLGRGLYDLAETFNSDGQHALVGQLRGEVAAGPVLLFGRADGSLTFASESQRRINTVEDPAEDPDGVLIDLAVDTGDLYGVQVGASVPAGPVVLGLAVFGAARTAGRVEYLDGVPEGFPDGFPTVQPADYGYRRALGVVPSVEYRAPAAPVVVRLDGSFSEFYSMENIPVGITLAGENGPVTRPAVTLSVSVGL